MSDLKLKNTFVLLVFSLHWNLNNCGAIGKAETFKDDRHTWTRSIDSIRQYHKNESQSFDGDTAEAKTTSSSTKYERDNGVKWDPVNAKANIFQQNWATLPQWNFYTVRDFDFDYELMPQVITWKPINLDLDKGKRKRNPLKIEIFMPLFFLFVLLAICKYILCKRRARTRSPALEEETPVSSVSSPTHVASGHSADSNGETDKPPDYSTFVMADFTNRHDNLACIDPNLPPPKYEEITEKKQ